MKGRLTGSSSLMVISLLLSPAAAADDQIGAVITEEYSGATGIRVSGEQNELRFQQPVHSEEKVVTEEEEFTQLQFLDESTLYVGANSVVTLDRFVYDPASQLGDATLSFSKGAFRFISGRMQNEEAIRLQTPKASLVIRGTTVTIYLFDDGSELVDVDGDVLLRGCGAASPISVPSGMAVLIDYVCTATLGYASGPESGPPYLESFRPLGSGPTGGQNNPQRGAQAGEAGEPPAHSPHLSAPPHPPPHDSDSGTGDGGEIGGCGDGI